MTAEKENERNAMKENAKDNDDVQMAMKVEPLSQPTLIIFYPHAASIIK